MTWLPGAEGNPIGDVTYPPLPIRVVDSIAPTLHALRRRRWERGRDKAFAEWEVSGVPFAIEEGSGLISEALNIIAGGTNLGGFVFGTHNGATDYGFAQILVYRGMDVSTIRFVVGHEAGHALGFWHGGNGIMSSPSTGTHPNAEELLAVKEYYLG